MVESTEMRGAVPEVPSFRLDGRVGLVTGACGAIGRAICHGLAGHGAKVVAVDHPSQDLGALVGELQAAGATVRSDRADLCDPEQVPGVVERAAEAFGSVDVLVNNAGINYKAPPDELSLDRWDEMWTVNVTAAFLLSRATMRLQVGLGRPLSIVNTSSIGGSSALGRGNVGFGASKAALNELTRELAIEWAPRNVRVNAVLPCQVETSAFDRLAESAGGRRVIAEMLRGIPLGRFARPEDIVGAVLFLASDAASMLTGALVPVDGGNLALNAGGTVARPEPS